jgi:hypothetical protein
MADRQLLSRPERLAGDLAQRQDGAIHIYSTRERAQAVARNGDSSG